MAGTMTNAMARGGQGRRRRRQRGRVRQHHGVEARQRGVRRPTMRMGEDEGGRRGEDDDDATRNRARTGESA